MKLKLLRFGAATLTLAYLYSGFCIFSKVTLLYDYKFIFNVQQKNK